MSSLREFGTTPLFSGSSHLFRDGQGASVQDSLRKHVDARVQEFYERDFGGVRFEEMESGLIPGGEDWLKQEGVKY